MTKYIVGITRISYGSRDVVIEADSPQEAEEKALEDAANHTYLEHDAEYIVNALDIKQKENA